MDEATQTRQAEERLKYLAVLKALQRSTNVKIELTESMQVSARAIAAAKADLSEIVVEDMTTPLGTVPHATLRGENIVSIEVTLSDDQVLKQASDPSST